MGRPKIKLEKLQKEKCVPKVERLENKDSCQTIEIAISRVQQKVRLNAREQKTTNQRKRKVYQRAFISILTIGDKIRRFLILPF